MIRSALACLVVIAAGLAGCGERHPGYRYRLGIEVEAGGKTWRGSNVVDVRFVYKRWPHKHFNVVVRGEAVYVDLGPGRRPLVALLTSRIRPTDRAGERRRRWDPAQPGYVVARAYKDALEVPVEDYRGHFDELAGRGPREIGPDDLPDLVTFADVSDPKSVMAVDPHDLEATLGPGVRWGRLTIEVTTARLTTGIEDRLPWLKELHTNLTGVRQGLDPRNFATLVDSGDLRRR